MFCLVLSQLTNVVMLLAGSTMENEFALTATGGCRTKVAPAVDWYGVRPVHERPAGLIDTVRLTSVLFSFRSTTTALLSAAPEGVPNAETRTPFCASEVVS